MAASTFNYSEMLVRLTFKKVHYKAGGTKMEYTEYVIKLICNHFNRKWSFAQCFL